MKTEITVAATSTRDDDRRVAPLPIDYDGLIEECGIMTAIECGFQLPWVSVEDDGVTAEITAGGGCGSPWCRGRVRMPNGDELHFRIDGREILRRVLTYTRERRVRADEEAKNV